MTPVLFFPLVARGHANRQWQSSNRALAKLIAHHQPGLVNAVAIAGRIRRRLEIVFPMLDELVCLTCPWCPEPCCIVNKVWYDFQDLLFLHLTRQFIPPAPLASGDRYGCRYLSNNGCLLPRILRPWACTLYLCPTQLKILSRRGQRVKSDIESVIAAIKTLRMDMEDAFISAISRKGELRRAD